MLNRRGVIGCSICALLGRAGVAGAATRRGIIDVHAHIQIADYLAAAAAAGLHRPSFGPPPESPPPLSPGGDNDASVDLRLKLMDEAGVRLQVLSPTLAPYVEDEDAGGRLARILNDRTAALAGEHKGRIAGFASLPLPHVEASVREIRRGLDDLGLAGVTMQTTVFGRSIADERFDPLFQEMNARGATLFLHPSVNGLLSPLIRDWRLTAPAGPLMEDAAIAMQLMARSIPVRYPDLRIIVPHLGGGLATMLERLDNQMPLYTGSMLARPSEMARRMWYDTVSHGSRPALRSAVEAFGADRLVPGSDFPVLLGFEPYADTFGYIAKAGLSAQDSQAILYENAPRLLGL